MVDGDIGQNMQVKLAFGSKWVVMRDELIRYIVCSFKP